jgi:hypothetical protein
VIFGYKDQYMMMFSKNEFDGNQYSETWNEHTAKAIFVLLVTLFL